MKTLFSTLCALACVCAFGAADLGHPRPAQARDTRIARVDLRDEIADVRADAWRLQHLMGLRRTPAKGVSKVASAPYQRWVLRLWERRRRALRVRALNPPHKSAFLCIHRYEGSWTAATGNGYYGGLQMDLGFQRAYGSRLLRRKGTANHWTPLEQIWVAERAHSAGRGFYPWPHTARICGLL